MAVRDAQSAIYHRKMAGIMPTQHPLFPAIAGAKIHK